MEQSFMQKSMVVVNVTTCDELGNEVKALSFENCAPQQLSSIISLCRKDYVVTIAFREIEIPNVMRPNTQD